MKFLLRWLLPLALFAVLAWAGFSRISFEVDLLDLLPQNVPEVEGLKLWQKNFSIEDELLVALEIDGTAEDAERAAQSFHEFLKDPAKSGLKLEVRRKPWYQEQNAEAMDVLAGLWLNADPKQVAALPEKLAPENVTQTLQDSLQSLTTSFDPLEMAQIGFDPLGITAPIGLSKLAGEADAQSFASADGKLQLLFVRNEEPAQGYKQIAAWLEKLRLAEKSWAAANPALPVKFYHTGEPAFVAEISLGMEKDMRNTIGFTNIVIALVFWLLHRRLKPLFWLLFVLLIVLVATLGTGGLLFGSLNVMSLGFAAILIGLVEDYGVVIYEKACLEPQLGVRELRRRCFASIFWAALTTALVFLALNFSVLPGLRQLGSLTALGIVIGAILMLWWFPILAVRLGKPPAPVANPDKPIHLDERKWFWLTYALFVALAAAFLTRGFPVLDQGFESVKPKQSAAGDALQHIEKRLQRADFWQIPVVVEGRDDAAVLAHLRAVEKWADTQMQQGKLHDFFLPVAFWPDAAAQAANIPTARWMIDQTPRLNQAILEAGFTEDATKALGLLGKAWSARAAQIETGTPRVESAYAKDLLRRFLIRSPQQHALLGTLSLPVSPDSSLQERQEVLLRLEKESREIPGVHLASWQLLNSSVSALAKADTTKVLLPCLAILLVMLILTYRNWLDVVLTLAVLGLTMLCVNATMAVLGQNWTLISLAAIPLLLGVGVDYCIHTISALEMYGDQPEKFRHGMARAIIYCASTTIAGFGSLAFSSNAGLAGLGTAAALGITYATILSVLLLPAWKTRWRKT